MKTRKIYKLAAFLLFVVMCTTTVVCPTLARYATNTELTNEARIAKWGVKASYSAGNTFARKYYGLAHDKESERNRYASSSTDDSKVTVSSTTGVIAPGTWGYFPYPTITGTPEVAVRLSFTADLKLTNWADESGEEYCPIVFRIDYGSLTGLSDKTLKIGGENLAGETIENVADLEAAVAAAFEAVSSECAANTNFEDRVNEKYTTTYGQSYSVRVFWGWPYSADAPGFDGSSVMNKVTAADIEISDPVNDTYLCNLSADNISSNNVKISFASGCTIEQID